MGAKPSNYLHSMQILVHYDPHALEFKAHWKEKLVHKNSA